MTRARALVAAISLALAAGPAAAAPRIESVFVKPNPVPLEGAKAGEVVVAVAIQRPTPLDLRCEALIDPGDGGRTLSLSWDMGDRHIKTARYQYKKAGSYRLKVYGTGKTACTGARDLTVTVGKAAAPATGAAGPSCPDGWTLVEGSARGGRFTCRPVPPAQALHCTDGTSYYVERGEIGCR